MKTIYLVRHAKSSWSDSNIRDQDRPLNKRGKRDAPFMGKLLSDKGIEIDLLITSSAVRAVETAKLIANELSIKKNEIQIDERLYHPSTLDFLKVINEIDNSCESLMLFSHNPGITEFANFVSTNDFINIPTCGIVSLCFDIQNWRDLSNHRGQTIFYEYPKKYFS